MSTLRTCPKCQCKSLESNSVRVWCLYAAGCGYSAALDSDVDAGQTHSDEPTTEKGLLEQLASIEHLQWCSWAQLMLLQESISPEREKRWRTFLVSYEELDDEAKEHDRVWARKVLAVVDADVKRLEAEAERLREAIAYAVDTTPEALIEQYDKVRAAGGIPHD